MLREGVYLQDRYEILELIGSGGMSDVYKARCHTLDRLVAIKVLKDEFSNDKNFVAKFKMEAQAAAGLSHPNIVSVYDVVDEQNLHYIVMELIEGITLKSYIAKKGFLDVKEAVGIAIQVAQGIAAAHEQNIIHRDIKPQNIIISRDGKVKVADFGIARLVTDQTQGSVAVGSVHYISPEQARGGYSDARSDIYSLGITMYEMVTGRLPFEGENTVAVALAHVEEPITRPSLYNPGIPISLENIILKCTEKRPERRYGAATEVIADLRKVLLYPDENFVTMAAEEAGGGDTMQITPEELNAISQGQKSYEPTPEPVHIDSMSGEIDGAGGDTKRFEVSRGVDRILAAVGVFVAVVIVSVLIALFSRLGGLFRSGSGFWQAQESIQTEALPEGSGQEAEGTTVQMPRITDMPEDEARLLLEGEEYRLTLKITAREQSTAPKGVIISQDPLPGEEVKRYGEVTAVVSEGDGTIDLSALGLTGLSREAAEALLTEKGLVPSVAEEYNDTVSNGMVTRYDPASAAAGQTVTIYVSQGPAPIMRTVPDLYNITEEEARRRLTDAGLNPGEITSDYDDTIPVGCVIRQDIPANSALEGGGRVSFVLSLGPEPRYGQSFAAISETFSLKNQVGPGAMDVMFTVEIRLRQDGDEGPVYRTLMEARQINATEMLPIEYSRIEAILPGTEYGEVEVVDVQRGDILASYPVRFFPAE